MFGSTENENKNPIKSRKKKEIEASCDLLGFVFSFNLLNF